MPDHSSQSDFASRIAQHRAISDAYRARAQTSGDELLRKVYAGLATTYENMALAIERTGSRIESIRLTTARARDKIIAAKPGETDDPGAAA